MSVTGPEYVSSRLVFRRFTSTDAAFVWELHANPDLVRFIPSAAMPHVGEAASWIVSRAADEAAGRGWWCVTLHDGTPVGAAVLKPVRYSAGCQGDEVEIGWRWHPAHTGRGYASEAGELLLASAFASGLSRVIAVVDPDNAASRAVCQRLGLTPAGRTDHYYDSELDLFEATNSSRSRQVTWAGTDGPGRTDHADVLLDDGLLAIGSQTTDYYRAAWTVDARCGWITRAVSVAVFGDGWTRALSLRRDPATQTWTSATHATGPAPEEFPAPGIADPAMLKDALDCDLGLCPLTNTMPIRRLGALEPGGHENHLTMAWVHMPSLAVTPSPQSYAPSKDGHVTYVSGTRHTTYDLLVDDDGLVLTYPGLAQRVAN